MSDGKEDAIRKNIMANIEYSKETRALFRELETKQKSQIETLELQVAMLQTQIQALQVRLFSGGATS